MYDIPSEKLRDYPAPNFWFAVLQNNSLWNPAIDKKTKGWSLRHVETNNMIVKLDMYVNISVIIYLYKSSDSIRVISKQFEVNANHVWKHNRETKKVLTLKD